VSVDAAPIAQDAQALEGWVALEQLRLVAGQMARVLASLVLLDGFLVWLLSRVGLFWPALAWAVVGAGLQFLRWHVARQPAHDGAEALRIAARLTWLFGLLGCVRAAIIPVLFSQPLIATHYVFTMVLVGLMAGAAGSLGGMFRAYAYWGIPVALTAAVAWWWQGTFEGRWVGVLMLLLFAVLASYVRDSGATLRQLVAFAHEREIMAASLRTERDRAQAASVANEALAESLRIERDRAEAASQSKTRFFAVASHDLRQPLHALSINATTLELVARKQNDPMVKELSQSINRALAQSNGLLEGLLDISRLDAGAVEVKLAPVDAAALLEAVVDEFRATAAQHGLTLKAECQPSGPLWIHTDFELMLRVLNNLVSNALKFTRHGGVKVYARALPGRGAAAGKVVLGVQDSGPGIAASEHERVFEEFYQIGNPSRDRNQGLGLGLSIVRRAVALLGATLTLHSAPGEGTRIELKVGAARVPRADARHDAHDRPAWPEKLDARVLVIDDEPEILESLAALLPLLGCEVRCVASLKQANAVLDSGFVPQILMVDYRLRDETGTEVIAQLRQRLGEVPALIVTGDTAPQNIQHIVASGCRVIHKPLDGARLAQALGQALAEPA
jgi:signal transduction histidine kinase/CheY-like chemotaxis protein